MMKKIFLMLLTISFMAKAQKKPKLVIGLVVDQMRYDYLLRFKDRFGNKGFNKIIHEGTHFENAHYNYIPTYTAVGHTSIYTGTTPKNHGIIGNNWYDKYLKEYIYVVDDPRYKTIGSNTKEGKKSPKRLVASTVADELKIAQNFKGKTIGIAIKDRSAILPVGHTADIAYWFDGHEQGKWISSSYYTEKLPTWVTQYNIDNKSTLDDYIAKSWNTRMDIEDYDKSTPDYKHYEGTFKTEKKPVFPHQLKDLRTKNGNYSILKTTPYGNTMTLDFAKEIIKKENLGKSKHHSDFLAISLSSTDYIGHKYGPASVEIEDTYLKLNDDLDDFIHYLNNKVGRHNYVLFVTADHAVVQVPHYLMEHNAPGGYFEKKEFKEKLNDFLFKKYRSINLIENVSNHQVFINKKEVKKLDLNLETLEQNIVDEIINYKDVYTAISAHSLQKTEFHKAPLSLVQEGYNQKRSGDIIYTLKPTIISHGYLKSGTTHGSGYNYDTHVPLIFYGSGIAKGKIVKSATNITQIAPTLSNLLELQEPNMSENNILTEVFE